MKNISLTLLSTSLVLLGTSISAKAANFSTNFSNNAVNLNLNGSAQFIDAGNRRVLGLTNVQGQAGSAFVSDPIPVQDDTSFNTKFTFRILNTRRGPDASGRSADGLTFLLQSQGPNAIGGGGGGLGQQGIRPSLGIELDTFQNPVFNDINGNHAAVNLNGEVMSVIQEPIARPLATEETRTAWVDYNGDTNLLEVRVAETNNRPNAPVLTYNTDLSSVLGNEAFVGFTSGTGSGSGRHRLRSWEFESTPDRVVSPTEPPGNGEEPGEDPGEEPVTVPDPTSPLGLAGIGILGLISLLRRDRQHRAS